MLRARPRILQALAPVTLCVGGLWCSALPAAAEEEELPADAVSVGDATGLLVVAVDSRAAFGGSPPTISLGPRASARTMALADDGVAPDGVAGDGIWVAIMASPPTGDVLDLVLADGQGNELWSDQVPVSDRMTLPTVEFVVAGDHVRAKLETVSRDTIEASGAGPSPGTGAGAPPPPGGAPPPPPGTTGAALPAGVTGGAGLIVAGLLGLMGLLAGVVLGLLIGRRGTARVELTPLGGRSADLAPTGMPPTRGERQAWRVGEGDQLVELGSMVATHLALAGPVVVAVAPQQREDLSARLFGTMGVVTTAVQPPLPHDLLTSADQLRAMGRPSILVLGPAALEAPEKGEDPDAVLVELLTAADERVDVVVLVPPGDWPGLAVRAELGLGPDGRLAFEILRWTPAAGPAPDGGGVSAR